MRASPITQDEIYKARLLRRDGMSRDAICERTGHSKSVIGRAIKGRKFVNQHPYEINRTVIPPEVLADRDRRLALSPPSLTAALMGDPVR